MPRMYFCPSVFQVIEVNTYFDVIIVVLYNWFMTNIVGNTFLSSFTNVKMIVRNFVELNNCCAIVLLIFE